MNERFGGIGLSGSHLLTRLQAFARHGKPEELTVLPAGAMNLSQQDLRSHRGCRNSGMIIYDGLFSIIYNIFVRILFPQRNLKLKSKFRICRFGVVLARILGRVTEFLHPLWS